MNDTPPRPPILDQVAATGYPAPALDVSTATAPGPVVAIHQPNLFPWLGFFNKVARADTFILLDHVVNNPRDPLWTKRVRILANGQAQWLTLPLKRDAHQVFLPIQAMWLADKPPFTDKHLRTLSHAYQKAPFFDAVWPFVEAFYEMSDPSIANRNIGFIVTVAEALELPTHFIRSSVLAPDSHATAMLVDLVKAVDGHTYLCGGGADGYQDDTAFAHAGLHLAYQQYQHPTYPQLGPIDQGFVPGLSILDALMNCGFEGTRRLIDGTVTP
ncbi:MAG: WbqC family protein [Cyanobacteria bacterium HKST-UBA04]|nr:WbqC family protein [Cyanobacteria bacterium HKST-UBA04]